MLLRSTQNRRTARLLLVACLAGSFVSSGCVEPFDPAAVLGESFQVLAIRAEPRAVPPGGDLEFSTIEYNPPGARIDPEQLWIVCLPEKGEGPEACLGAALGQFGQAMSQCSKICAQDPDRASCEKRCNNQAFEGFLCPQKESMRACIAGYGPLARYELPLWFSQDKFFTFLLAAAGPDGLEGCFNQWAANAGGFPAPTDECTISFKRISVAAQGDEIVPNPTVASLSAGLQTSTGEQLSLHPEDLDPKSRHVSLQTTTDAGKDSFISWFSDCGTLEHSRTFGPSGDNRLTFTDNAACSLFVVVRDTSYGVGWLRVDIDPTSLDLP